MPYGDSITITIPAQTPEPVPHETAFMSEIFVYDLTHADIADAFLAVKGVGSLIADETAPRYAYHEGKLGMSTTPRRVGNAPVRP